MIWYLNKQLIAPFLLDPKYFTVGGLKVEGDRLLLSKNPINRGGVLATRREMITCNDDLRALHTNKIVVIRWLEDKYAKNYWRDILNAVGD